MCWLNNHMGEWHGYWIHGAQDRGELLENMENRNCSCHRHPMPTLPSVSSSSKFTWYALSSLDSRLIITWGVIFMWKLHTPNRLRLGFSCLKNPVKSSQNHCQALSWQCHADCHADVTSLSVCNLRWEPWAQPGQQQLQSLRRLTGLARAVRCVHRPSPANAIQWECFLTTSTMMIIIICIMYCYLILF